MSSLATKHRARAAAAVVALALACAVAEPLAQEPTLEDVLARTADYVDAYQRELSNVIAQEAYIQSTEGRRQRMRSDLLVFSAPGSREPWVAFRDVIEVDGLAVEDRQERLADLFTESPVITRAVRRKLVDESARFNIGRIQRNFNVPTMALLLLGRLDQPRLSFEKVRARTDDGILTWEVDFEEVAAPALIQNAQQDDLFARGTVWIEPTTGRVRRTELSARDRSVQLEIEFEVRYEQNDELDMLVPASMTERYAVRLPSAVTNRASRSTMTVECLATYSNFRRFDVQVEMSVDVDRH